MKLNNNQKILLGLAIGGGLAWLFLRNKTTDKKSVVADSNDQTNLAKTREQKIEYILDNLEATDSELMSGFSGDRFEFDPTIGYAIPIGKVDVVGAGEEMIISRDGNFANEIYFNADGEETDNPVEEAIALLNELSDAELDIVYACVLAKKKNPNVDVSEIITQMPADADTKRGISKFLNKRMNDIKSIKKSPRWTSFWNKRREDGRKFMAMFRKPKSKGVNNNSTERREDGRKFMAMFRKPKSKGVNNNSTVSNISGRVNRSKFRNEVINRGY